MGLGCGESASIILIFSSSAAASSAAFAVSALPAMSRRDLRSIVEIVLLEAREELGLSLPDCVLYCSLFELLRVDRIVDRMVDRVERVGQRKILMMPVSLSGSGGGGLCWAHAAVVASRSNCEG